MSVGGSVYRLSKRRRLLGASVSVAIVATILALYRPTLWPPGMHSRGLEIGTATTQLLVASPNLAVGGGSYQYTSAVNQGTLLGNVMVGYPVLSQAARAIGVPEREIQATAPMTANVPRVLVQPGSGASATAILKSPDQYKLEIQADPSVPVLHIYTQAPTAAIAIRLAQASINALLRYVHRIEVRDGIPTGQQISIEQMGPVQGGVANPGAAAQIALLVFLGVFGITLWLLTLAARVRQQWLLARLTEQL